MLVNMRKHMSKLPLHRSTHAMPDASTLNLKLLSVKKQAKQLEKQLNKLTFKYNAVFNTDTSHFIILNKQLLVIDFNKRLSELIKQVFDTDVQIGFYIGHYLNTDLAYQLLANCNRALAGENFTVEHKLVDEQGRTRWWQGDYAPAYDNRHHIAGMVFNAIDITDRKNHELKIEKQNRQLREISLIQSHDIRGPVCTLAGLMNLIQMEGKQNLADYLPFIAATVAELDKKVCDIVDLANEE